MSKAFRIFKFLLIIIILLTAAACAPAKKNTYAAKRKQASKVNTSQLGRNRYYFSSGYQKKLITSYKKKRY